MYDFINVFNMFLPWKLVLKQIEERYNNKWHTQPPNVIWNGEHISLLFQYANESHPFDISNLQLGNFLIFISTINECVI